MKIGTKVLDVWLANCFGPKWHKTSFEKPDTKIKIFFKICEFCWIYLKIVHKMKSPL